MKKKILTILITILAGCTLMFTMTACVKEVKLKFVVDNEIYATIDTNGAEIIQMPENPTKEDYTFDGWFWDKDVWEKPFTANSLLDAPLFRDMSVYAKFTKNHTHEYNSVVTEPTCTEKGYTTYTCSCGDSYVDAYVDELGHEYGAYISNNNGTKTGTCECGYSIIAVDEKVLVVENNVVKSMTEYGKTLSKIVIPNSITSIDSSAFRNCSSLTSVEIPDSVTSIGKGAFSGCTSLTSITLPFVGAKAGVTSSDTYQYPFGYIFGTSSYTGSYSAEQYYYGSSTSSPTSSTYYIPSSLKSVTITGGNILRGAFYGCSSLTSIVIPDSVTSIGDGAFIYCSSLTSVVIGDNVTSIGEGAFAGCSSLTSVIIPDSVTSIGELAFYYCSSLTYNVKDGLKYLGNTDNLYMYLVVTESTDITIATIDSNCRFIGSYAFYDCDSLTSIEIPESVTSISYYAFYYCSSLKSIDVEENNPNYKSIDGNLFSKDGKTLVIYAIGKTATTFTIPNGVTSIGEGAFAGCSSLASVVIGDSVTSIGENAFEYCTSLTSIVIPDSVTSIGDQAFYWCSSLTSVVIPDSVTSIGDYAFYYCRSLTSIEIPDSVTSIGEGAFYNCDSLISVEIPNSVTSIGGGAFYNCSKLTSIEIPDSVESIGDYAFGGCYSLTSVVIPNSVTSIGKSAFYDCDSLTYNVKYGLKYLGNTDNPYMYLVNTESTNITIATIDSNCRIIGSNAFYNCNKLKSIVIPDSVTSICDGAFYGCYSLTSVVIGDSVTSIGDYAFYYCSSLESIKYRGTESQWQAITKGTGWNSLTGKYTITYNYTGE